MYKKFSDYDIGVQKKILLDWFYNNGVTKITIEDLHQFNKLIDTRRVDVIKLVCILYFSGLGREVFQDAFYEDISNLFVALPERVPKRWEDAVIRNTLEPQKEKKLIKNI